MIRKTALAALAALGIISNAYALDSTSFEFGQGNEDTELWRLGLQWNWKRRWFAERAWTLGAYWDLQAGQWRGPLAPGQAPQEVWDFSVTPVFRLERAARTPAVPYLEAAIGFHLLSNEHINFERNFSTHFQYGSHLGAGLRFGPDLRYDAELRVQHLSNGGLEHPNPGINFAELRFGYRF
jgi:hypothetical protein